MRVRRRRIPRAVASLAVAGSVALACAVAGAQPAREPPAVRRGVRGRFGIGAYAGYARGGMFGGAGGLIYLRGGVQFSDLFGLDFQASAVTIVLDSDVRAALTADFALTDWFSIGTGFAVHTLLAYEVGLALMYAVPLRLAFHAWCVHGRNGSRHAFEVLFEGDAGVVQDVWGAGRPEFGAAGFVGLGYAMY